MISLKIFLLDLVHYINRRIVGLFKKEVLVLGDSHAVVFRNALIRKRYPNHLFHVVAVGGATVSGLRNPNSKTGAGLIFSKHLEKYRNGIVIFLIGEVDAGFVIWYRAEKHKEPVKEMLGQALDNYKKIISDALKRNNKVICVSAPLPTIKDDAPIGKVANQRKEVAATQKERTELTIEFNSEMERYCSGNGIKYVNLDSASMGENGLVTDFLLNHDPEDHHYNEVAYAELIVNNLKL